MLFVIPTFFGNWGTKRLNNLPTITKQVAKTQDSGPDHLDFYHMAVSSYNKPNLRKGLNWQESELKAEKRNENTNLETGENLISDISGDKTRSNNKDLVEIQVGSKVGLQLWKHDIEGLFFYYYLLIIIFFHTNNCKLTFAPPCINLG